MQTNTICKPAAIVWSNLRLYGWLTRSATRKPRVTRIAIIRRMNLSSLSMSRGQQIRTMRWTKAKLFHQMCLLNRSDVSVKEVRGTEQWSRSRLVEQHEATRNQKRSMHHNTTNRPQSDHRPRYGEDTDVLRGVVTTHTRIFGQVRKPLHIAVGECRAVPRAEYACADRRLWSK
eukprot:2378236-Prymnesium_polylepis.1